MIISKINIEKGVWLGKERCLFPLILCIVIVAATPARAGFEKSLITARTVGMGGAGIALKGGALSLLYNPANAAITHQRDMMVSYSPAPFGMTELAIGSAVMVEQTSFGTFGLMAMTRGFELYREVGFGVSFADRFDVMRYGATLNYYSLSIERYGSSGVLSIDLGIALDLTDKLSLGASVVNANQPRIGEVDERLPTIFSLGACYLASEDLIIVSDMRHDSRFDPALHFGVEYSPLDFLHLRIGNSTEPSQFTFGFGVEYERVSFDYALMTHADLGESHLLSIGFRM